MAMKQGTRAMEAGKSGTKARSPHLEKRHLGRVGRGQQQDGGTRDLFRHLVGGAGGREVVTMRVAPTLEK